MGPEIESWSNILIGKKITVIEKHLKKYFHKTLKHNSLSQKLKWKKKEDRCNILCINLS